MTDQTNDGSKMAPADLKAAEAPQNPDGAAAATLELDDPNLDIEAAMRDALSAVEAVAGSGKQPAAAAGERQEHQDASASGTRQDAGAGDAAECAALRGEVAELRDRLARTLAEFDNFRKRAERERQETRRYALLEPLREFLPVADNLDRALSAGGSAEDLKRGVEMILRQMQELLRRFGVREVAADGEVFNPALHEAVARVESDRVAVPTVTETLVRGYMLHDRLLRPAMVKVAVPAGRAADDPSGRPDPATPAPGGPGSHST
jgi:molecular chaperone GrpE